MGMFNNAMLQAPKLVDTFDLSKCQNLLDMGGGPGTYAIHFCRHNPQLKATVFDLPTSRPFAEKTIERFDLSDRIDFQGGTWQGTMGRHHELIFRVAFGMERIQSWLVVNPLHEVSQCWLHGGSLSLHEVSQG